MSANNAIWDSIKNDEAAALEGLYRKYFKDLSKSKLFKILPFVFKRDFSIAVNGLQPTLTVQFF